MNFFDAQDQARRTTRWLVVVYVVSTALIVAGVTAVVAVVLFQAGTEVHGTVLGVTALATTAVILGASLFKTAFLAAGGSRVAEQMGGTPVPADTTDPLRRRLRNVVEEMAIASGVPVPDIYVLEKESGINAFAAGFTPGDAAVAVTKGSLELLDRDELQGVIAHEFSHILNGDMRLNIRMMGVLFGIMVVGLIGRAILRGSRYSSGRRGRNGGGVLIVGLGLTILGWIGVFCSRVIKAAVSRQREFLADASAVQFTRQTDGIAGALKKIGGFDAHSYLRAADPEEVSHMLFGQGQRRLASIFATHPPLGERIRALDPSFRESDYPVVRPTGTAAAEDGRPAAGIAAVEAPASLAANARLSETVGRPGPEHLGLAQRLHRSIPPDLREAAHSPEGAYLLTIALIVDPALAVRQLALVEARLGEARARIVCRYVDGLQALGARYWLPILEIAFPALKRRPADELTFLVDLVRDLAEMDGHVDLREFCFYRIVARHLRQASTPAARDDRNRVTREAAQRAAVELLRIVADQGSDDAGRREQAFQAGLEVFGAWPDSIELPPAEGDPVVRFGRALDVLAGLNAAGRGSLVDAVAMTIARDERMTLREAELLRAVCATLDCPLPPLLSAA